MYEVVIGLEVHAHLATRTKMFCACPRPRQSNIEPNTLTCPVCLGMPGVLPVVNEEAVKKALKVARALNCIIPPVTHFDRKNYYYPDLPKNYQISQNYNPLGRDGWMEIEVGGGASGSGAGGSGVSKVGIDNVHLEEDAGKSVHPETGSGGTSGIDLNRAGTPLLEVVTKPDMRSIEELEAFVEGLREMLQYLDVSECRMEEGQLRFEVSLSLRPYLQRELGTRVEVKNLNSVRSVLAAARYEVSRQGDLLDAGDAVARETRLWDEPAGVTRTMRSKELAHDYRYFPEPDLVPVVIPPALLEELRAELPELPLARRSRFVSQYGLPAYDAGVLTSERELADYFEAMLTAGADAKAASNWVMVEMLRELTERTMSMTDFPVPAEDTVELLSLVHKRRVTYRTARKVFSTMIDRWLDLAHEDEEAVTTTTPPPVTTTAPLEIVEEEDLAQISESGELERAVARVIAENPKPVADYRAGRKQAFAYLVGQLMRVTKGKANPQLASELLEKLLAGQR